MRLKKVQVAVEPFELRDGMMKLRIEIWTEKQNYTHWEILEEDHLESCFDRIFQGAGAELKREMKKAGE